MKWEKSSYSGNNGNCVERAVANGSIYVRDSKDPSGPVLVFSPVEWEAFVKGIQNGELGL